jgi:hypothetical protein
VPPVDLAAVGAYHDEKPGPVTLEILDQLIREAPLEACPFDVRPGLDHPQRVRQDLVVIDGRHRPEVHVTRGPAGSGVERQRPAIVHVGRQNHDGLSGGETLHPGQQCGIGRVELGADTAGPEQLSHRIAQCQQRHEQDQRKSQSQRNA